jgi:hypothetical protein
MNVGIEIIAAFEDLEFLPECIKQLKVRGNLDQPHISGTGTKRGRALAPATIRAARGLFFHLLRASQADSLSKPHVSSFKCD